MRPSHLLAKGGHNVDETGEGILGLRLGLT